MLLFDFLNAKPLNQSSTGLSSIMLLIDTCGCTASLMSYFSSMGACDVLQ